MSELEHSLSHFGSVREEIFQQLQVLFRIWRKLEQNRTVLLSKRSQCHPKSLCRFNRSFPEFQDMRDLSWRFEREPEIVAGPASPRFYHRNARRSVEGTVDFHTVEPLTVIGQEIFTLQVLRVEVSFPPSIAETRNAYHRLCFQFGRS